MPEWKQFANLPFKQAASFNQLDWLGGHWRLGLWAQTQTGDLDVSLPMDIQRNLAREVENHLALELGFEPPSQSNGLKSSRSHTKLGPLLLAGAVNWLPDQNRPLAFGLDLEWGHRRPISLEKDNKKEKKVIKTELANKFLNASDHPKLWSWATTTERFLWPWCLKEASFKAASNLIQQTGRPKNEEFKVTLLKEVVLNKIEEREGVCFTQGFISSGANSAEKPFCHLDGIFFTTTFDFTIKENKKAKVAIALARATWSART